jgi:AraC-like DNA-binding protein
VLPFHAGAAAKQHGQVSDANCLIGYRELHGVVEAYNAPAPPGPLVALSSLKRASMVTRPVQGVWVRYVGRGLERYRISEREHRLGENQIMVSAQPQGAEIDFRSVNREGTLGLCIYVPDPVLAPEVLELGTSLTMSASCSPLGKAMNQGIKRLLHCADRNAEVARLMRAVETLLPALSSEIWDQFSSIDAAKHSTRLEALRKVNLARAYLHETVNRSVDLAELASVTGVSPFHLLRLFKSCLGVSPSAYHRKLRVSLARQLAERRNISLSTAAELFGFAGASSFSHAHRRAFGTSATKSRRGPVATWGV